MAKRKHPPAPEICPMCGEDVPRGALACPECGADHQTGWSDAAQDYPEDEEFDYEEFTQREFGHSPKPHTLSWFWWIAAIVVAALTALLIWWRII